MFAVKGWGTDALLSVHTRCEPRPLAFPSDLTVNSAAASLSPFTGHISASERAIVLSVWGRRRAALLSYFQKVFQHRLKIHCGLQPSRRQIYSPSLSLDLTGCSPPSTNKHDLVSSSTDPSPLPRQNYMRSDVTSLYSYFIAHLLSADRTPHSEHTSIVHT